MQEDCRNLHQVVLSLGLRGARWQKMCRKFTNYRFRSSAAHAVRRVPSDSKGASAVRHTTEAEARAVQRKWRRWKERFLAAVMVLAIVLGVQAVRGHYATQEALEGVRSLAGQTWCNNTDQIGYVSPDGLEIENVGGWPCMTISRTHDVRTVESDLCAYVVLNQEAGPPGEDLYRETTVAHCSPIENGSWGFKDALFTQHIRNTLNSVNTDLCTRFRDELREEDWYELC